MEQMRQIQDYVLILTRWKAFARLQKLEKRCKSRTLLSCFIRWNACATFQKLDRRAKSYYSGIVLRKSLSQWKHYRAHRANKKVWTLILIFYNKKRFCNAHRFLFLNLVNLNRMWSCMWFCLNSFSFFLFLFLCFLTKKNCMLCCHLSAKYSPSFLSTTT
jgi:hypothetical protein